MLHQHKSHTRIEIDGHGGKKSFESCQPSGRCPDADNGETRFRMHSNLLWNKIRLGLCGRFFFIRRVGCNRRYIGR